MNTLTGRISLDFRSNEPIYLQIVRQVEGLVAQGTLKPGAQLPTVRELAIDLRINFSTVARAYRILDEQRLISTQRGRGTYIWDEPTPGAAPPPELNPPGDAQLIASIQGCISEGLRLGYTLEEIKRRFNQLTDEW